jgi:hypothetical protein
MTSEERKKVLGGLTREQKRRIGQRIVDAANDPETNFNLFADYGEGAMIDEVNKAAEAEFAAILAEREAEQGKPWPQEGDEYWWVDMNGLIGRATWDEGDDRAALEMGLVRRTEKEAETKRDWLRAVALVEKIAREENPAGWKKKLGGDNWYIVYDQYGGLHHSADEWSSPLTAFATKEIRDRAAQALKDANLYDAYMRRGEG